VVCALGLGAACGGERDLAVAVFNDHDVVSLDPHRVGGVFQTQTVLANLYEPLVAIDADLRLAPALAVSWTNPDDLTWEFELRRGVRFHTGGEMGADDVVASITRSRAAPGRSLARAALGNVDHVESLADGRVRIRTREPDATLLRRLRDVLIVSRAFLQRSGPESLEQTSAGTGPYRLVARVANEKVELARFDGHWREPAAIRRAVFMARSHGDRDVERLLPGGSALVFWEPVDAARRAAAQRVARRLVAPSLTVSYLGFDLHGPTTPGVRLADGSHRNPFLDARVREAIDLAIDRTEIARMLGHARPAADLVASGVLGHSVVPVTPGPDLSRARQLLAEAGFPAGFEVDLDVRTLQSAHAEPLVARLGALGIRVILRRRDEDEFFSRLRSGGSSLYVLRFSCRSGDAQELLDKWAHSRDDARGYGEFNYSWDRSPAEGLDERIERTRRILAPLDRLPQLQQVVRELGRARLALPLLEESSAVYASASLEWKPRADGFFMIAEMREATDR
jgi:peptide/nickel transport system substrate-binding protein